MISRLALIFISIIIFLTNIYSVSAAETCTWQYDPLSCTNSWYKCTDHVPTCAEYPGGCTSDLVCGVTGCYNCAQAGTCGPSFTPPPSCSGCECDNSCPPPPGPLPTPTGTFTSGNYFQLKCGSAGVLSGQIRNYGQPTGSFFSKDCDDSTTPGIPLVNGAYGFGGGSANSKNWVAGDSGVLSNKLSWKYDMDQIKGRIISSVKPSALLISNIASVNDLLQGVIADDGARYLQLDGNLIVSGNIDIGDNKIILIVNGDVDISKNININDNNGYFAIIASGDINVDPSVGGAATDPDTVTPILKVYILLKKTLILVLDQIKSELTEPSLAWRA